MANWAVCKGGCTKSVYVSHAVRTAKTCLLDEAAGGGEERPDELDQGGDEVAESVDEGRHCVLLGRVRYRVGGYVDQGYVGMDLVLRMVWWCEGARRTVARDVMRLCARCAFLDGGMTRAYVNHNIPVSATATSLCGSGWLAL
jgi:hypothetical protein